MDELTESDVLHVADLARVSVSEDEVELYKKQLNQILTELKRINEVDVESDEIMISPSTNKNVYREDIPIDESVDISLNAPKTNGNYIEIKRVVND